VERTFSFAITDLVPNLTLYEIDFYRPVKGFYHRRWTDQDYENLLDSVRIKSTKERQGRVKIIRSASRDATGRIPPEIDFLYVDGDHRYSFVVEDLINYEPKVLLGGLVSGHDYNNPKTPGVALAVDRYAALLDKKVNFIPEQPGAAGGSWWWTK
jgi:hypothetical protein